MLAIVASAAHSVAVPGQGTWETTLHARDIAGRSLGSLSDREAVFYYDAALDITWLRDWNFSAGDGSSGLKKWADAVGWADNLIVGD